MSRWKPQVIYITSNSSHEYWYNRAKSQYITKEYKTYAELKKDLPTICKENIDDDGVSVYRSRRGQWGEWFETWKLDNGVPTIVKEGWS
jgi:hypothetical protein